MLKCKCKIVSVKMSVESVFGLDRFMPDFHHSVAFLLCCCAMPLYRCRSSIPQLPLPLRLRTEMLKTSFRIHRDEVTRTLIGCPPTAERQKQDSILFATERQLRRNGRWKRQRHNGIFLRMERNSYGIYVTAAVKWQRQNDNGMLETRHQLINVNKCVGDML